MLIGSFLKNTWLKNKNLAIQNSIINKHYLEFPKPLITPYYQKSVTTSTVNGVVQKK